MRNHKLNNKKKQKINFRSLINVSKHLKSAFNGIKWSLHQIERFWSQKSTKISFEQQKTSILTKKICCNVKISWVLRLYKKSIFENFWPFLCGSRCLISNFKISIVFYPNEDVSKAVQCVLIYPQSTRKNSNSCSCVMS